MTTPVWKAGTQYAPGALAQQSAQPAPSMPALTNPDFESGNTGWTVNGGTWSIDSTGVPFHGAWDATCTASGELLNNTTANVTPGHTITASCVVKSSGTTGNNMQVMLVWYDSTGARMVGKEAKGNGNTKHDLMQTSTVTATAPAGAASFKVGASGIIVGAGYSVCDYFTIDYAYRTVPPGLLYRATQAGVARSGPIEPNWPGDTTTVVIDGGVTWQGEVASRVTWQAHPIFKSGTVEPTWPTDASGLVSDGTMQWQALAQHIADPKCPAAKVVAIMASKVFAADGDIVRFCATVNPLDWSSAQDAGYLPTGLQQANANAMAVLAPYRSNLTAFNASSFQNWQVDPDPTAMALLDQMEGIGSSHHHAAQPVGNDLFYLSQMGVRSVSIAAASDSLAAGDVGMPVDSLVQAAVKLDTTTLGPRATYFPGAGQYWLAVDASSANGGPQVFVCTVSAGQGKWSRYLFPWSIDAFAQLADTLYIRHGDEVSVVTDAVDTDDVAGVPTAFTGTVQWPWLDCGQPGMVKMMESFDYVGTGQGPSVAIGYDQANLGAFTPDYLISTDTLTGEPIPLCVAAPTLSVKLTFAGGAAWSLIEVILHVDDMWGRP